MEPNNTTQNNQDIQRLQNKLDGLVAEAEALNNEIDNTNKEVEEKIDTIGAEVNESIGRVREIYSDLDKAEEEAGNALDEVILEEIEESSKD